jgi:hypothetical protein
MIRSVSLQSIKRAAVQQRSSALAAAHQGTSTTTTCPNHMKTSTFSSLSNPGKSEKKPLFDVVPKEDFGSYKEYSVIFTNRSLNLMSDPFQKVMRDLNTLLKHTYNARKVAIIPG